MPNGPPSACNHGNGRPTRSWPPPRAAAQETASRLAPVVGGRPDAGRDAHVRFVRQRAIRSGTRYGKDLPARPGDAVILVEPGGRISDGREQIGNTWSQTSFVPAETGDPDPHRAGRRRSALFRRHGMVFHGGRSRRRALGLRRGRREVVFRCRGPGELGPSFFFKKTIFGGSSYVDASILPLAWGSPWHWLSCTWRVVSVFSTNTSAVLFSAWAGPCPRPRDRG